MVNDRIRELRKLLGLSVREFAKRIGISRGYLSDIENGKVIPPDRILLLISHTFGISYEWLKEGKGEMWEKKEVPEWLKEFVENAKDKDIQALQAFIQMLKEVPEEEKDLLLMMLKKLAGSSQKG